MKKALIVILPPILIAMGYMLGVVIHPAIAEYLMRHDNIDDINVNELFANNVVNLNDETIYQADTLSAHKRNLLVLWSPTCNYCKSFFQYQLNTEIVGLFCFPIFDDIEYLDFYIKKHNIEYPQLMIFGENEKKPVEASFVRAIPMFLVVDDKGNIVDKKIGIEKMDDFINNIYKFSF